MAITAESQGKAEGLKEAYVLGLLGGASPREAAAAETIAAGAGAAGDTASILVDLERGTQFQRNDGNPTVVIQDGSAYVGGTGNEKAAYPLGRNAPYGATRNNRLSDEKLRGFADRMYSNPSRIKYN